jgi:hypothetical protein
MRFLDRFKDLIRFNQPEKVVVAACAPATDLGGLKLVELRAEAKERGLKGYTKLRKAELLALLSE